MAFAITPTTNAIRVFTPSKNNNKNKTPNFVGLVTVTDRSRRSALSIVCAVERSSASSNSSSSDGKNKKGGGVPNSNYVVPLETSFPLTNSLARPLAEILRDLNKRIPDNIVKPHDRDPTLIPWYHANRMLSFYAPGWCGEIRDVIFSDNGSVTVVYRVTVRGSDGEAHRESTGTVSPSDGPIGDAVAAAEEIAFCKACARFGLGLYLYHEDQLVLHVFSDEDSVKVLKKCREAISSKGKEGKVIIIDIVINEENDKHELTEAKLYLDRLMMALVTGREREEKEWEKLFLKAGFRHYKITPIFGTRSFIEVYP